jgi:transposase
LKRGSYLAAQYRRLVKRRGDKKAIVALAHSIPVIAYHVLRDGQSYRELGGGYFDRLNTDRVMRYHTKRLAALGYTVTLTKHAAEPPFSYYLPREEPGRCREAQGGGQ